VVKYGTINPTSVSYCIKLPLIGKSAARSGIQNEDSPVEKFAKFAYTGLADYMTTNHKQLLGIE
jgi:hypothetical protein